MLFDKFIEKKVASFEQEIMQKYYAEVENMYRKMRGWRHDYRHHIQTMKVHAINGEYEAICDYLDMLDDDLTNVETVIKTGTFASAFILICCSIAIESLLFKIASAIRFPVLMTVSTFVKSSSNISK